MKKLILSLLMITMLTGCVSEPVSRNEINTDFEELCNYFDIDKLESEKSYQNDNYQNYITYEINNHMNYSEKADIINYSFFGNEKYLRHISVETDASNGVNNVDMDWYKYNENGDICETDSPFYAENILGKMQSFDLTSELGEKLYNEDYLFAKETNSSVGTIEVFYCDMNKDGKDDIISYIEAPWIQGKDKNIRLSVSVDGEDGLIPLEDEIFLLNIRNNPLIFVNIEESDTDMRNIVVEYFYRETAEYQKICYVYDSEKEKYRKF